MTITKSYAQNLILNQLLNHLIKGDPLDYVEFLITEYERVDGDKRLISLLDNYLEQYITVKDLIINEILKRIDIQF